MFGILSIMNERSQRENKLRRMKHKQKVVIEVDPTKETLERKLVETQRIYKEAHNGKECILTECVAKPHFKDVVYAYDANVYVLKDYYICDRYT